MQEIEGPLRAYKMGLYNLDQCMSGFNWFIGPCEKIITSCLTDTQSSTGVAALGVKSALNKLEITMINLNQIGGPNMPLSISSMSVPLAGTSAQGQESLIPISVTVVYARSFHSCF